MIATDRATELMNRPVHLTGDEIEEMLQMIRKGELPPDAIERQRAAEARSVFGHDAKRDSKGNYIEQGIGSRGGETLNHFTALARAEREGFEKPGSYARAVEEIWRRDPTRAKAIGLPQPDIAA